MEWSSNKPAKDLPEDTANNHNPWKCVHYETCIKAKAEQEHTPADVVEKLLKPLPVPPWKTAA